MLANTCFATLLHLVLSSVLLLSSADAEEISRSDFIDDAENGIIANLCGQEKFLNCTSKSRQSCELDMRSKVLPYCFDKVQGDAPSLDRETMQAEGMRMAQCSAVYFSVVNDITAEALSACMLK